MDFSLSLSPRCRQSLSLGEVTGGLTGVDTVFPAVDAWLQASTDHWAALQYVAARKDMARYRSVTDFLLCEVVTEERAACLRYYERDGKQLREVRSPRVIAYYEAKLLLMLEVCYAAHCEQRRLSWAQAVAIVVEMERAA